MTWLDITYVLWSIACSSDAQPTLGVTQSHNLVSAPREKRSTCWLCNRRPSAWRLGLKAWSVGFAFSFTLGEKKWNHTTLDPSATLTTFCPPTEPMRRSRIHAHAPQVWACAAQQNRNNYLWPAGNNPQTTPTTRDPRTNPASRQKIKESPTADNKSLPLMWLLFACSM